MSAWIVIPMKSFASAKSRLGSVLDRAQRPEYARELFGHVLGCASACVETLGLAGILVLTNGDEVAALAARAGADVLHDHPDIIRRADRPGHLGRIVDAGLSHLARRGAAQALVLMADLPRLERRDIARMLERSVHHPMVVAPDSRDRGTNALVLTPPDRVPTCFGHEDSLSRHLAAARAARIAVSIYRSPSTALDIDRPDDLGRVDARVDPS